MRQRRLGNTTIGAIGLGGMPMSIEGRPDEAQAIATIHAALDAGVTHLDTADSYHLHAGEVGHNERLLAKAVASYGGDTSSVLIATKGGHLRPGDGSWTQDGRPEYLVEAGRASAERLGGPIGLYYYHRPDPAVPYADSVGALAQLLDEGVIVRAGISNASIAQIDIARGILGDALVAVQNQFSPAYLTTRDTLDHCARLGIAFLPWSPLGGISRAGEVGSRHAAFAEVATAHGVSPQQVVLAWLLSLDECVIPIPGASKPSSIVDSAAAADLQRTDDEVARLGAA